MTTPLEPIRPRVEPAVPARRVDRTGRDGERRGGQGGGHRQQPEDEHPDEEQDGLHVDVRA